MYFGYLLERAIRLLLVSGLINGTIIYRLIHQTFMIITQFTRRRVHNGSSTLVYITLAVICKFVLQNLKRG